MEKNIILGFFLFDILFKFERKEKLEKLLAGALS